MHLETQPPGPQHRRPWRLMAWGSAALLLLLPAVLMQFTAEIRWDAADFLAFGTMLLVAGLAGEAVARWVRSPKHRLMLGGAIVLAFLLVWVEAAVGIFH
ncbi:hypothetical protein [Rubrivivax rivuli]|nr:hypothetical protein [Rubrivivax rivuli]